MGYASSAVHGMQVGGGVQVLYVSSVAGYGDKRSYFSRLLALASM